MQAISYSEHGVYVSVKPLGSEKRSYKVGVRTRAALELRMAC